MVHTVFATKPKQPLEPSRPAQNGTIPTPIQHPQKSSALKQYLKFVVCTLILVLSCFQLAIHVMVLRNTPRTDFSMQTMIEYSGNMDFPAVTVCNNNRLQKSKLCHADKGYCGENIRDSDIYDYIYNKTGVEILPYTQTTEEFIETCATISGTDSGICGNITRVYFEPMINCFTVFSQLEPRNVEEYGEIPENQDIDSLYLALDFQPYEFTETYRSVGGQFLVHDGYSLPEVDGIGEELLPGRRYTISIEKTTYKRLPYPYTSNCRDYRKENSGPKSQKQCVSECLHNEFLQICGCMPLHEVKKSPIHQGNCNFINQSTGHCYDHHVDQIYHKCETSCPLACVEEEYNVKMKHQPFDRSGKSENEGRATLELSRHQPIKNTILLETPAMFFNLRDMSLIALWGLLGAFMVSQVISSAMSLCSCKKDSLVQAKNTGGSDVDAIVGIDVNINSKE